jgi:hypothetical protein
MWKSWLGFSSLEEASMPAISELDKMADRLPADWKKRVAAYRGNPAMHYQRVLGVLTENCSWMTIDERERAAFVYVEKELLREAGHEVDDDD